MAGFSGCEVAFTGMSPIEQCQWLVQPAAFPYTCICAVSQFDTVAILGADTSVHAHM